MPEWFKNIIPQSTKVFEDYASQLFSWIEESVWKIERRTYTFDGKPDIRWNVSLKSGEVWQGHRLHETLSTARKGDGK